MMSFCSVIFITLEKVRFIMPEQIDGLVSYDNGPRHERVKRIK